MRVDGEGVEQVDKFNNLVGADRGKGEKVTFKLLEGSYW